MSLYCQKISTLEGFLTFNESNYQIFGDSFKSYDKSHFNDPFRRECPICYCSPKIPTRPNTCTHIFCFKCLNKWWKSNHSCPYCRAKTNKLIIV